MINRLRYIIACLNILLFTNVKLASLKSCISPENKKVDWFMIYLLPKNVTNNENMKFAYFDSENQEIEIYDADENIFPPIQISESLNDKKTTYLIWNDDATNGENRPNYDHNVAHSKGLLSYNNKEGVYIIHSLPRFPFRDDNDKIIPKFASNVGYYGQTFFCMNIDYSEVSKIISALRVINAQLILLHINKKYSEFEEDIINLANKNFTTPSDTKIKVSKISTREGLEINLFIKNSKSDLPWESNIPDHYQDGFQVETWVRPELLPNVCNETNRQVLNIVEMDIKGYKMKNDQDHSKWAVSLHKNYICHGDLNRNPSQKHRSGTIACVKHKNASNNFKNIIKAYEPCKLDVMNFLFE